MFGKLGKWWRRRQRRLDVQVLWPQCWRRAKKLEKEWGECESMTIYFARSTFAYVISRDPAWTKDFTQSQIEDFIGSLKPVK